MKDRLFFALILLAMLLPPWNVFWWLVSVPLYVFWFRHDDESGDGFTSLVLGAPVAIPCLIFVMAKEAWQRVWNECGRQRQ